MEKERGGRRGDGIHFIFSSFISSFPNPSRLRGRGKKRKKRRKEKKRQGRSTCYHSPFLYLTSQ